MTEPQNWLKEADSGNVVDAKGDGNAGAGTERWFQEVISDGLSRQRDTPSIGPPNAL